MSECQFDHPPRTIKEPCQTCNRGHLRAYGNLERGLAPCGLPECEWDEDHCIHINRIVQDHWMSPLEGQGGLFLIRECYCPDCKATFQAVSDGRIIEGTLKRPKSSFNQGRRST